MKEFLKKYKKVLIIILLILLLIGIGIGVYFMFFRDGVSDDVNSTDSVSETGKEVSAEPEYDERSSREAILATYENAKVWSSDVVLYDCSGVTMSSVEFPDVKYYFLGADQGKYATWNCTYYSKSLGEIKIFQYDEGVSDEGIESMEIGEFGYLTYDAPTYITDLSTIADSSDLYATALENGLNDTDNYVNMYMRYSNQYGPIWKLDERSKEVKDEYGIGELVNVYLFDIYTGSLKDILQEEVY
jgi:hypothetical protein